MLFRSRIKSDLTQLVDNAVKKIQQELSGISGTMDKYLVDEIVNIQDVLTEYEKGMKDVNNVVMTNFTESKTSMINTYNKMTSKQKKDHSSSLSDFALQFNENVEEVLTLFSEQSEKMKTEVKSLISSEKESIQKDIEALSNTVNEKIDSSKQKTEQTYDTSINEINERELAFRTSLEEISSKSKEQMETLSSELKSDVLNLSSQTKEQISNTRHSTDSEIEMEANDLVKKAENAEKNKKDVINKIVKLEKSLDSVKNEL